MIAFTFFIKGFTALCAQVLLIREFFVVVHGNELSFGIFLAIWVIAGAAGSFLSRFFKKNIQSIFLLLVVVEGIWLFASITIIRSYHYIFTLSPGQLMNITQSILLTVVCAGVFNFLQGMRFVIGGTLFFDEKNKDKIPGLIYGWEAAGSLAGGFVFAFLIQKYTNPFQSASIIFVLSMISCVPLLITGKKFFLTLIWCAIILMLPCFNTVYSNLNNTTLTEEFGLKTPPVYYANTHYGNITVFQQEQQLSFMIDGSLVFTLPYPDTEWIETISHFPLLYSKKAENILVIGAGIKGVIPEILKYKNVSIDCVEINPELIHLINKFSSYYFPGYSSEKIKIITDDAIGFLRKTTKKWDVIILDAGFPLSLKTSRFYTVEFYSLIKNHLSEEGIFFTGIDGSPDYMSKPLADVHTIIYSTMTNVFTRLYIVPGYFTCYCATKNLAGDFSPDYLISQLKEKNIPTKVITPFYLKDRLSKDKIERFFSMIGQRKKINTCSKPIIIIPAIQYWVSLSGGGEKIKNFGVILFPALCFLLCSIFFIGRQETKILEITIFSTGFLSIAWELIFLFLFQTNYGSVYFYLSILTGIFMGGMTCGSIVFSSFFKKFKKLKKILFVWQMAQMVFALLFVLIIVFLKTVIPAFVFFVLMAIAGFFTGWEFPLVNSIYLNEKNLFSDSISRFYSFDLAGATLGSLLTATFLVPVCGIVASGILFFIIKMIVGIFVCKLRKL